MDLAARFLTQNAAKREKRVVSNEAIAILTGVWVAVMVLSAYVF